MMKNYKEELIKEIQQIDDEDVLKFLYKFLVEFKRENRNLSEV